jgi:hypothetical protein
MDNNRFLTAVVSNARQYDVVLPWERKGLRSRPCRPQKIS